MEVTALVVSLIAAGIALVGPYLENLRTGRLRMFYPQDIYFMTNPGIGVTAFMFDTAKRGHRVREMVVRVTRGKDIAEFSAWTRKRELTSGVFVPFSGLDELHTFFFPPDGSTWEWHGGVHNVDILAKIDEAEEEVELSAVRVELTPEFADVLNHPRSRGVWFQ